MLSLHVVRPGQSPLPRNMALRSLMKGIKVCFRGTFLVNRLHRQHRTALLDDPDVDVVYNPVRFFSALSGWGLIDPVTQCIAL